MPQSLILNLVAESSIPQRHLQGYSLQQLFFDLVDSVDLELGRVLRRDKQNRSYSVSALQFTQAASETATDQQPRDRRVSEYLPSQGNIHHFIRRDQTDILTLQYAHYRPVAARSRCWWRISLLDDDLFAHLAPLWNQLQDEVFQLGSGSVKIADVAADLPEADWAASCNYSEIYECASAHERDIHFQFVTPVAFGQQGQGTLLPTPDAMFHPLRRCWNHYSGLAFVSSIVAPVAITHLNIQTETVQSYQRQSSKLIVSCTGQISYQIMTQSDPLIIKQINTLADFTRYCPVGCNTLAGMGVIHRLSSRAATRYPADTVPSGHVY
ncbi:MAG: CRISPR system precrRNA processing endoribonuclease RAMP protein Cas6 [Phormidesmis sp.]